MKTENTEFVLEQSISHVLKKKMGNKIFSALTKKYLHSCIVSRFSSRLKEAPVFRKSSQLERIVQRRKRFKLISDFLIDNRDPGRSN